MKKILRNRNEFCNRYFLSSLVYLNPGFNCRLLLIKLISPTLYLLLLTGEPAEPHPDLLLDPAHQRGSLPHGHRRRRPDLRPRGLRQEGVGQLPLPQGRGRQAGGAARFEYAGEAVHPARYDS